MASKEFAKALAKRKDIQSLMKQANDAKAGEFTVPDIEPGKYLVRVKLEGKVNPKTGVPMLEIRWTIVDDSPYNGKGSNDTYWLENDDAEREANTWKYLGRAIKVLTDDPDRQIEEVGDLVEIIEEVNAADPIVEITLKKYVNPDTKKIRYTLYYNGIYEQDEEGETQDEAPQDDEAAFSKGDVVEFDGEEWTVFSSNVRDETCTLKSNDDPKTKRLNVAWNELTLLSAAA